MKYLGVDWGFKKVGLAYSEGELADPLESLNIKSLLDGVDKICQKIRECEIDLVVMGKPEGEMGKAVEKACFQFTKRKVKVILADETLSTRQALQEMLEMGYRKKSRQDDNAVSAAIILQRWLDNNSSE